MYFVMTTENELSQMYLSKHFSVQNSKKPLWTELGTWGVSNLFSNSQVKNSLWNSTSLESGVSTLIPPNGISGFLSCTRLLKIKNFFHAVVMQDIFLSVLKSTYPFDHLPWGIVAISAAQVLGLEPKYLLNSGYTLWHNYRVYGS